MWWWRKASLEGLASINFSSSIEAFQYLFCCYTSLMLGAWLIASSSHWFHKVGSDLSIWSFKSISQCECERCSYVSAVQTKVCERTFNEDVTIVFVCKCDWHNVFLFTSCELWCQEGHWQAEESVDLEGVPLIWIVNRRVVAELVHFVVLKENVIASYRSRFQVSASWDFTCSWLKRLYHIVMSDLIMGDVKWSELKWLSVWSTPRWDTPEIIIFL